MCFYALDKSLLAAWQIYENIDADAEKGENVVSKAKMASQFEIVQYYCVLQKAVIVEREHHVLLKEDTCR